jgi:hypothetical protein
VHIINLPNPSSKTTILKIVILVDSEFEFKFKTVEELDFRQSANSARALSLNDHNHCGGYQNCVCE